jgi:hypothetical protein
LHQVRLERYQLVSSLLTDENDVSAIVHVELVTNTDAAAYKKMVYGEEGGRSQAEATDLMLLFKRASRCGNQSYARTPV